MHRWIPLKPAKTQRISCGQPVFRHSAADNQRKNKRVESLLVRCLDGGSTPPISTEKCLSDAWEAFFYLVTPVCTAHVQNYVFDCVSHSDSHRHIHAQMGAKQPHSAPGTALLPQNGSSQTIQRSRRSSDAKPSLGARRCAGHKQVPPRGLEAAE